MENNVRPSFDFSVPDWEYLAVINAKTESRWGHNTDYMTLIYKDGQIKAKTRIKFPSGNILEAVKHYSTLDEAISETKQIISEMPEAHCPAFVVIINKTTKGQDLFDAMLKSENIEIKITRPDDQPS